MPSLKVIKILVQELATAERAPRVPEPDLVMDGEEQVRAYTLAGGEGGTMAPVYLFHTVQLSRLIRAQDLVVDLACGSANQLIQVARLHPQTRFLGVDLSPRMLDRARRLASEHGLANCEFRLGSITDLSFLDDRSVDVVMSTLAFHHLPDTAALELSFREAARILKSVGGVYFADLGHLRREASIAYFGHQYADRQPAIFTEDYVNSLRAAFSLADFRRAAAAFGGRVKVFSTFLVPYMIVVKSAPRSPATSEMTGKLQQLRDRMPDYHRVDFHDLRTFFRLGGLQTPMIE